MIILNKTRGGILVGLVAVLVVIGASPAGAATAHLYTGQSFGPEGTASSTRFTAPGNIAVEQSTGNVYVYAYGGEGRFDVYKFNSSGAPVDFSALGGNVIEDVGEAEQIAVSSAGTTEGDIYLANPSGVRIYGPEGTLLGELGETAGAPAGGVCGVAVDPAGNVYVALFEGYVNKYTPTTAPVTAGDYASSLSGLGDGSCNLAVDSAGSVYVDTRGGAVSRYEASQFNTTGAPGIGAEISELGGDLAVGPGSSGDDIYIDRRVSEASSVIAQYGPSGVLIGISGESGPGALRESSGIAVYDATGDLYATTVEDETGDVKIFGPTVVVAEVSTGAASSVSSNSARLEGTVNPDEVPLSSCSFEYGTETTYGQSAPCEQTSHQIGASAAPVTAVLRYAFRGSAT